MDRGADSEAGEAADKGAGPKAAIPVAAIAITAVSTIAAMIAPGITPSRRVPAATVEIPSAKSMAGLGQGGSADRQN
jgi:hypothetical protein